MRTNRWGGPIVAVACTLAIGPVVAQSAPVPTALTPRGAREDLELAIATVEAALPDLYWHQSRRAWSAAKADARARVTGIVDSAALWRILRPLMGRIGEGHLAVQPSDAMNRHYRDLPRFPLDLLWTVQGAWVLAGYGGAADIARGTRLRSIDGIDESEWRRRIVAVSPHDGVIRTGAMRDASGRGFASILFRLRGPQTRFHVVLDGADGQVARDLDAVPRLARPTEGGDPPPLPTLQWIDKATGYLDVPTFSNARLRAVGATFPDAIHAVFRQLVAGKARNLILDLRDNGGGSEPNEAILFSYLVAEPLRRYAAVEARGRHIVVTSLSGRRFETDVFDAAELRTQRPIGHGRLTRRNIPPEGLMSRWTPYVPVYHGRLVILAGGDTFSGGAELASMLYHTHRAVFVGEEVGGGDDGNTSGHRWTVELLNSRMRIEVPLLQFRMTWAARPHGRGVLPDCYVPPDVMEAGRQRDRAWRTAVALLGGRWTLPHQATCPRLPR